MDLIPGTTYISLTLSECPLSTEPVRSPKQADVVPPNKMMQAKGHTFLQFGFSLVPLSINGLLLRFLPLWKRFPLKLKKTQIIQKINVWSMCAQDLSIRRGEKFYLIIWSAILQETKDDFREEFRIPRSWSLLWFLTSPRTLRVDYPEPTSKLQKVGGEGVSFCFSSMIDSHCCCLKPLEDIQTEVGIENEQGWKDSQSWRGYKNRC